MRLEDLLVDRGEPHSRFVDLRPESKRHTMAMSASDSREVLACDDLPPDLSKHDLVIALDEQLEDLATSLADVPRETWPDLAVILPGAPGRANVPEVLDWATRNDWQLVDLSPVRLPQCVCALLTGRNHAVPPEPLRSLESSGQGLWKRLVGELLFERLRATTWEERALAAEASGRDLSAQATRSRELLEAANARVVRGEAELTAARDRNADLREQVAEAKRRSRQLSQRKVLRITDSVAKSVRRVRPGHDEEGG